MVLSHSMLSQQTLLSHEAVCMRMSGNILLLNSDGPLCLPEEALTQEAVSCSRRST